MRRKLMFITGLGMLIYWSVTLLMAVKILDIPGEWLFKDYHDQRVMAWNWSFFPLDIALSLTGLRALHLEKVGHESWKAWAIVSLTLTVCAGLMAISYWVLVKDFDMMWWVPNVFLMVWPLPFLWKLAKA